MRIIFSVNSKKWSAKVGRYLSLLIDISRIYKKRDHYPQNKRYLILPCNGILVLCFNVIALGINREVLSGKRFMVTVLITYIILYYVRQECVLGRSSVAGLYYSSRFRRFLY